MIFLVSLESKVLKRQKMQQTQKQKFITRFYFLMIKQISSVEKKNRRKTEIRSTIKLKVSGCRKKNSKQKAGSQRGRKFTQLNTRFMALLKTNSAWHLLFFLTMATHEEAKLHEAFRDHLGKLTARVEGGKQTHLCFSFRFVFH